MGLSSKKILRIPITIAPKEHILEEIRKYLRKIKNQSANWRTKIIKPLIIFTPNPEIIVYSQKDARFKQIVASSQINIPDGAGICWAMRKKYDLRVERLSGVDFMQDLSLFASKESFRIGIIGGRGGVAVSALECLHKQYPELQGWAMDGPEMTMSNVKCQMSNEFQIGLSESEMNKIVKRIIKEKTDILFVALGFPKQEYFIDRIQNSEFRIQKPLVMMAVGGALDYISGKVARTPKLIREMGLEWMFRLIKEPWRLSRQFKGAEFFIKVLLAK